MNEDLIFIKREKSTIRNVINRVGIVSTTSVLASTLKKAVGIVGRVVLAI